MSGWKIAAAVVLFIAGFEVGGFLGLLGISLWRERLDVREPETDPEPECHLCGLYPARRDDLWCSLTCMEAELVSGVSS
jgi:hypothetical protein